MLVNSIKVQHINASKELLETDITQLLSKLLFVCCVLGKKKMNTNLCSMKQFLK